MKIKGNIIKSRIAFVKERFGEEAWQKVLAALPEEDRRQLMTPTNVGWYEFELGDRLDKAIAGTLGNGSMQIFRDLGRASARENLGGVHSTFLQPRDPARFMAKAPVIYRFYYATGERAWQPTGPTSGVLVTTGGDTYSAADCATVMGWYEEALAMLGASAIAVEEETCCATGADACRYRVTWQ